MLPHSGEVSPHLAEMLADAPSAVDFRARFRRGPATLGQARRASARRGVTMRAAALSIAAVIVAASWQVRAAQRTGAFAAITETEGAPDDQIRPMPFETPGDSFTGSAYYYLAQDETPSPLTPGAHDDGAPDTLGGLTKPGPSARALIASGAQDQYRALDCLTAAVYFEAASEPDDGQRAVAQVVLNRVAHPSFPKTVCGVVYQGSDKGNGCQFTFACDGALLRPRQQYFWDRARQVARAALSGYVFRPVGLATHYHTFAVHPYWDDAMNFIGQIGAHRFFRFNGPAGLPAAFRFAYGGGEPLAQPLPRLPVARTGPDATDPLVLERTYEASLKQPVPIPAAASPAPSLYTSDVRTRSGDEAYRATSLPQSNGIRVEYQNSGRWIGTPQ